jgi:hypothetical protein
MDRDLERFWSTFFIRLHDVNDANNRCVNRAILATLCHAGRTALYDQYQLSKPRADGIDGDNVAFLILAVDPDRAHDQEFSAMKPLIFSRCDHGPDYSGQYH